MFRLLPVNPGPDVSTAAAAVLADLPAGEVRAVLARLVRAHLVEAAAGAAGRWRMHDLLRLYAQPAVRRRTPRLMGGSRPGTGCSATTWTWHEAADDHLRALPGTPVPAEFTGRDDALAWLDAERPSLVAAVTMAADTGRDQVAMRLAAQPGRVLLLAAAVR